MLILPAIDIIDGKPVRLYKGDYSKKETVGEDILDIAIRFQEEGAKYLHLVDLDGAKIGKRCNSEIIVKVAKALEIPIEVGGGIRSMKEVEFYLDNGISRVILGTAAIENEKFLKEAVNKYGEKIAVGLDCKDGYAYGRGWLEGSEKEYIDFAKYLESIGVKTIIFTDISKDGTMEGPNLDMLNRLKKSININIIASGGIRGINHIKAIRALNVYGAITGKAMYAKTLDLYEAILVSK